MLAKKRFKAGVTSANIKQEINTALFNNEDLRKMVLEQTNAGDTPREQKKAFKKRVFSHLFIDETIEETGTYIFYDVVFPSLRPEIKTCQVWMYLICHRSLIDDYESDKYYGNRIDALTQMVEDSLLSDDEVALNFGIGRLSLDSTEIYNSMRMYGHSLVFSVPDFR